jgi:hypothetical protein
MALARYSQKAHTRWKAAEEKYAAATHGLTRERKQRKQLQADLEDTKTRAASDSAALEKARANLEKWEERMPVITSLMAAVTPMSEQVLLDALPIGWSLSNIQQGPFTHAKPADQTRLRRTEKKLWLQRFTRKCQKGARYSGQWANARFVDPSVSRCVLCWEIMHSTELTPAQQPVKASIPRLHQGSESATSPKWRWTTAVN